MICLLGALDPNLAWDGRRLYRDVDLSPGTEPPLGLRGAAGSVVADDAAHGRYRVVRDPLGLNKLFWARASDGALRIAARPWRLIAEGHRFEEIRAFPRGCILDLDPGRGEPLERIIPITPEALQDEDVPAAGRRIRRTLDRYLAAVASAHPSADAFVCLSGGLDSSGIAALVREHFPEAVAVSFDLETGNGPSDDRRAGARVARDLGLALLEANANEEGLLVHLDTVLRDGIDWRDFNVHAGLVNAVLAESIAEAAGSGDETLVFTGDLANEFLVDYGPERYRGATYYQLPQLSPRSLRTSLVRGLDSCHREIGVFGAWKLPVVQPYAVACDTYLSLPEAFLRLPDRKQLLARMIFDDLVPEHVMARPKARAQLGGARPGGVLAACVDRGLDAAWLRRRFCELHGIADARSLDGFVRAGRYRSATPSQAELVDEPA